MKNFLKLLIVVLLFSCGNKTEKKEDKVNNIETKKEKKVNKYQESLKDYRTIDTLINNDFQVYGFGMKTHKPPKASFVFKVANTTKKESIEYYSVGLFGYNSEYDAPFKASGIPKLVEKEGQKYVVFQRDLKGIKYFDSLDIYFYKRKDYKTSGRLGQLLIEDILFQ
ncbi:MAG: hypothetical protein HRT67_11695 [Flavobacteriaceae bacterium]|nr:hypothetical protein [Flavobacteriaceae bacterium]